MNEFGLFGRLGSNVVVRVIHLALCALLGLVVELAGSIVYGQPGSLEPGFKNGLRGVDSIRGVSAPIRREAGGGLRLRWVWTAASLRGPVAPQRAAGFELYKWPWTPWVIVDRHGCRPA